MIKIPVYNMAGEKLEEIELDEARLGGTVSRDVVRQAIITYEANQRAGTAKTKTRGQVAYSDKKPWPQKHTGRARAGTRASPVWVGGGIIFGPVPRDHSKKMNKKMRRRAVASALLAKLQEGAVKVLDTLELPEAKTREAVKVLKNLDVQRTFLLVLPEHDPTLLRCVRNIAGAVVAPVREINTYEIVKARTILFTRAALAALLDGFPPPAPVTETPQPPAGEGN